MTGPGITGRTALYGVIGHPITHSRSPQMQNAAFDHAGLDARYVALPVPPDRVDDALRGAHALGFQGLNVTVPHKQRAAAACLSLDPTAEEVGAVNTLRRTADGWEGFNTDAPACLTLLEAAGVRPGAKALLVGAGGAARAAAWALLRLGADLTIAARRLDAAAELCTAMLAARPHAGARARPGAWADLAALAAGSAVIVNGTSVGLAGHEAAFAALGFQSGQVALDFVYGATDFMARARAAGARLVTGEQILVRQGALAFTLWTGRPAPEAVMTAALGAPAASPSPPQAPLAPHAGRGGRSEP